jgi:hypothetical protein
MSKKVYFSYFIEAKNKKHISGCFKKALIYSFVGEGLLCFFRSKHGIIINVFGAYLKIGLSIVSYCTSNVYIS